MAVLREALQLVRLAAGPLNRPRPTAGQPIGVPGMDHRQLAHTIREMLNRYHGRLPHPLLAKTTATAAAGRWEKATHQLITALSVCAVPITTAERDELRTVLTALHMPAHRADIPPARRQPPALPG